MTAPIQPFLSPTGSPVPSDRDPTLSQSQSFALCCGTRSHCRQCPEGDATSNLEGLGMQCRRPPGSREGAESKTGQLSPPKLRDRALASSMPHCGLWCFQLREEPRDRHLFSMACPPWDPPGQLGLKLQTPGTAMYNWPCVPHTSVGRALGTIAY